MPTKEVATFARNCGSSTLEQRPILTTFMQLVTINLSSNIDLGLQGLKMCLLDQLEPDIIKNEQTFLEQFRRLSINVSFKNVKQINYFLGN